MKTLMLVDDFQYDLKFLQNAIDWAALSIRVLGGAKNGEEAMDMIARETPDIVLTDIEMPVLDGIGLTKRIKAAYPGICVVFMSCHEDFEYAKTALSLQVKAYITKPLMPEEIAQTFGELIGQMEKGPAAEPPRGPFVDKRIDDVKRYIAAHISKDLTVQSIARTLYISPNYLNSLFKEHEKITIPRYIEQCRIEHACALLRDTPLHLYEIAARVGYQNVPYFGRLFKQITGHTPMDYRGLSRAANA